MSNVAVVRSGTATDGLTAGQSKGVRATAISAGLGPSGIAAASLMIGALFVGLSLSGLPDRLRVVFIPAVVCGIQLSVGILLVRTAWEEMVRSGQFGFRLSGGLEGPVIDMTVACVGRPWCSRCPASPRHAGTA